MTKQKPSQRKALRATKGKGTGSARRRAPHPSSAASETDRFTTLVPENARAAADNLESAFHWLESREGFGYWRNVYERLRRIADTPKSAVQLAREASDKEKKWPPTNEMGAERAHASEPVQSPEMPDRLRRHFDARALASKLNSENLKPRPEPDPNPWPRLKAFVRKLLRR